MQRGRKDLSVQGEKVREIFSAGKGSGKKLQNLSDRAKDELGSMSIDNSSEGERPWMR